MNNRSTFLLSLVLVCTISCVEHRIFFQLHPDGNTYARFQSVGDSLDIYNQDFIHPSFDTWTTKKESFQHENEKNWRWISEGMIIDTLVELSPFDSHQLGYIVQKDYNQNWFSQSYTFNLIFQGRQVEKNYPKLYESIIAEKTDSLYWLPEALTVLLAKSLKDIYGDSLSHQQSVTNQRLVNHLNNSFSRMTSLEDLSQIQENRIDFFRTLLAPLKVDPSLTDQIIDQMAIHENILKKTIDLNDDHFQIKLLLPGSISFTNAMDISNDTLIWNFGLDSLLKDDYTLSAKSVVYDIDPAKIILIFAGIFTLIFMSYKLKEYN